MCGCLLSQDCSKATLEIGRHRLMLRCNPRRRSLVGERFVHAAAPRRCKVSAQVRRQAALAPECVGFPTPPLHRNIKKRDAESVLHFRLRIIRALPSATTLLGTTLLEQNLAGDLNDSSWRAQCVDRSKLAIRYVPNWVAEMRRVGRVKHLQPRLQLNTLSRRELLKE